MSANDHIRQAIEELRRQKEQIEQAIQQLESLNPAVATAIVGRKPRKKGWKWSASARKAASARWAAKRAAKGKALKANKG